MNINEQDRLELVLLLQDILPEYGAPGSRDVDVTRLRTKIERAIGLLKPPDPNRYNDERIAWELDATAMGHAYFGNALRVAMDIPYLTDEDRQVLGRYATGTNTGTDHVKLQDISLRIRTRGENGLVIHAQFETESDGLTGQTAAPIKRITRNDDGSLTVVIDHWPQNNGIAQRSGEGRPRG